MKFQFTLERSILKQHQAVGFRCAMYCSDGTIDANSVNAVREILFPLMLIPGVYEMRIRNAEPGNNWLAAESIDTRTPDQVPSAAKTVKRRAVR